MTRAAVLGLVVLVATACDRPHEPAHEKAAGTHGAQEVRLSEEAVQAAGIKAHPVSRAAFRPHLVATGVIRPVTQRSVMVRALVAGRVLGVGVDVGDRVTAGQRLATMEGAEVTATLARNRTASARQIAARQSLERAERLLAVRAISRAEVDLRKAEAEAAAAEAEAARQDLIRMGLDPAAMRPDTAGLAEFPIAAPIGGVVTERAVSPGLLVERDAPLFAITDLSTVWAVVDIHEKDLGQVQEKGEVEIRTDAYPGAVFSGRIALIEPTLDEASRTAHARVVLDNASGKFRPGLFVTVAVPLRDAGGFVATAIPGDAVQRIAGLPAVFVEKGPGLYEVRPVQTGREARGMVEIRHGIAEGETVVTEGAFILKSEILKSTIGGDEH